MNPADAIRDARRDAHLTQAELAARSGTSQAAISAYEHSAKIPTAATLARLLAAAGVRLVGVPASHPVQVPNAHQLERRSRILAQVLGLAERLPARSSPRLRFPRLPPVGRR
jgi:transcriptional regulator with XRE-family HTH domain